MTVLIVLIVLAVLATFFISKVYKKAKKKKGRPLPSGKMKQTGTEHLTANTHTGKYINGSTYLSEGYIQNGKYKIIRHLSSGGFGNTYEAELVLLHKKVAIKEFFVKDFCNRDDSTGYMTVATQSKHILVERLKQKFLEEASSLFTMQHKNIIRVTDVFEENGTAYYVMDYVNGESLHEKINREGALPESKAIMYVRQIADALRYVHCQNRLHLDIKPGNIMIDQCDCVYLIDFGASKQYDEENGENTSTLLGRTPGYAPLEQMANDVIKFTPATDIYSLGATLYKLVTGITPPSASLLASGEELEMAGNLSVNIRNAIRKTMNMNKRMRPQSIDEFMLLLDSNLSPNNEDTLVYSAD